MDLCLNNLSFDVFFGIGYDLLEDSIDHRFPIVQCDHSDLRPLPFVMIIEFSKGLIIFFFHIYLLD